MFSLGGCLTLGSGDPVSTSGEGVVLHRLLVHLDRVTDLLSLRHVVPTLLVDGDGVEEVLVEMVDELEDVSVHVT